MGSLKRMVKKKPASDESGELGSGAPAAPYVVLARKYRPRSFSEMVGQDAVVRALTHALEQKRLHHAYLFTGTRGIGKTTVARILDCGEHGAFFDQSVLDKPLRQATKARAGGAADRQRSVIVHALAAIR